MVRLVTHNLLACHAKDCNTNNFPLVFQNVQLEIREAEFNPGFIQSFLPKIEWNALVKTAQEVGLQLNFTREIIHIYFYSLATLPCQ